MLDQMRQSLYVKQVKIAALLLYQNVFEQEIGETYKRLLQCLSNYAPSDHQQEAASRLDYLTIYGKWFRAIAATGYNWRDYIISQILASDNPFSLRSQNFSLEQMPSSLVAASTHDLRVLEEISLWGGDKLIGLLEEDACAVPWKLEFSDLSHLPETKRSLIRKFQATDDWAQLLPDLVDYYQQAGTGIFTNYDAFRWSKGRLEGITYPDLVRISDLVGYEHQRQTLYRNTEAFLSGYHGLHTLLYGSRGTGKSSLVKSLMYAYRDRGLRLIEVAKHDLKDLPIIADLLRQVPQKFIIFVDDLSFEEESEDYKALKIVLEGNLSSQPDNLLVYATSNRRHLLREYFSDRPSLKDLSDQKEVNPWDTMQEKLSLSDRFGLTLTFLQADQEIYLKIVHHLAKRAGIELSNSDLDFRALQWATRHNGQSGRTAQQFINYLQADLQAQK